MGRTYKLLDGGGGQRMMNSGKRKRLSRKSSLSLRMGLDPFYKGKQTKSMISGHGAYSPNILSKLFGNMEKVHIPESCPHSSLTLAHKLPCLLEETWSGLGPCSLGDLATFLLATISPFLFK